MKGTVPYGPRDVRFQEFRDPNLSFWFASANR